MDKRIFFVLSLFSLSILTSCSDQYTDNLKVGKSALEKGNYEEAKKFLTNASKQKPNEQEPQLLTTEAGNKLFEKKLTQGRTYLEQGNIQELMTLLNDLDSERKSNDKISSENIQQLNSLLKEIEIEKKITNARKLMAERNYIEAANLLQKITEADTEKKEKLIMVKDLLSESLINKQFVEAKSKFEAGEYKTAIDDFTELLKNDSLTKFLDLKKQSEELQKQAVSKEQFIAGKKAYEQGDYSLAVIAFTDVVNNDPLNAEAKNLLSKANKIILEQQNSLRVSVDFLNLYSDYKSFYNKNIVPEIDTNDFGILAYVRNDVYVLYDRVRKLNLPTDEFNKMHENFLQLLKLTIDYLNTKQKIMLMPTTTNDDHFRKIQAIKDLFPLRDKMVVFHKAAGDEEVRLLKKYGL